MDKSYVKLAIDGLKSSSAARVQESLLKIRSKVIANDEGIKLFREIGGLEYLLPHLRKPNERILDITLSVLGNCCLEDESSILVGKLNSFGPLVTILKNVCRDSIVGRACRVIGNLAQKHSNAEGLHNHGAVSALVAVIENRDKNTSYPTLTMAVRAIRQLWMIPDKREEMLSLNTVRCVAILLTVECESVGVIKSSTAKEAESFRKSQEELITGILKCLGYFTTHATSQCAEQLQGDGRGYQCLVALTKTHESLALKCLMNLCYLSSSRPMLGTAGFVESLVNILEKISLSEVSWWPEGAARTLAQLSGEAVNRSRLRHARGLPLLLAAARQDDHALHALLQYVFDDTSFQILISEGLISFLTDELNTYLESMEYEHHNMENADMLSETGAKNLFNSKEKEKTANVPTSSANKTNLFMRRRQTISKSETDELKVVIERDNMIVGFIDAIDSDSSDDDSDHEMPVRHRGAKRPRSRSPKTLKKKPLIKMASKDWSSSVYWEPKSPEWPLSLSPASPAASGSGASPDRCGHKRPRWECSPESGVSLGEGSSTSPHFTEYQWSPSSSSGAHSPFSAHDDSSDSEMSGRYSPVCSDTEPEPEDSGSAPEVAAGDPAEAEVAADVAEHLDDLAVRDSDDNDDLNEEDATKPEIHSKLSRVSCVLILLFRVSHGTGCARNSEARNNHTPELLTDRSCVNALLDYVERCKWPYGRASRILRRVLSNALCLLNVLKHGLPLRLHAMAANPRHPPAKCRQCKQIVTISNRLLRHLSTSAESSYGIGEISYQLLKGSACIKKTLCVSLPYIVRRHPDKQAIFFSKDGGLPLAEDGLRPIAVAHLGGGLCPAVDVSGLLHGWMEHHRAQQQMEKPLKKYFVDCNALNLLLTIVAEDKEEIQASVVALAKLATHVHIKDPKTLEKRFSNQICVSYDPILDNLSVDEIVTFRLDDSSTVQANKVFLCQNSDVFSAMLMGCFKESSEKCVQLKNVSKNALEYLLTLLHCGMNNTKTDVEIFPLANELETNLEVLLLADRFLFEKVKDLLTSAILQFQLGPSTADKIYVWSLSEGMGFLCVESVAYLLTGKMCDKERTQSFRNILSMEYKEQWLDDIKCMIMRQLAK